MIFRTVRSEKSKHDTFILLHKLLKDSTKGILAAVVNCSCIREILLRSATEVHEQLVFCTWIIRFSTNAVNQIKPNCMTSVFEQSNSGVSSPVSEMEARETSRAKAGRLYKL